MYTHARIDSGVDANVERLVLIYSHLSRHQTWPCHAVEQCGPVQSSVAQTRKGNKKVPDALLLCPRGSEESRQRKRKEVYHPWSDGKKAIINGKSPAPVPRPFYPPWFVGAGVESKGAREVSFAPANTSFEERGGEERGECWLAARVFSTRPASLHCLNIVTACVSIVSVVSPSTTSPRRRTSGKCPRAPQRAPSTNPSRCPSA
jgi:hypothetical protein